LQILDTADQEAITSMRELYYKNGDGFVLVYSVVNKRTLDTLEIIRKEIMAPPSKKIDLSPAELSIDLSSSSAPSTTLTISNHSDDHLAFKVRTTNPKRYLVKPNQDVLLANSSVTVTIQMQARECAAVLEAGFDEGKDKFMISNIVVDDAFVKAAKAAKEAGSKESTQVYSDLWNGKEKDDILNRRMACTFIFPAKNGAGATATNGQPPGSSLKPPVLKASAPEARSSAIKAEKSVAASPAPSTAAPQASPVTMSAVPAAQTPGKRAEDLVENAVSSAPLSSSRGGDAESSYETLSKQYKETLATLVQVTEERDRFQAKFKDVSRELVQARDEVRSSRKGGKTDGVTEVSTVTKSGYPFWHLVVVAMVSFLVARVIQLSKNEFLSF